MLEQIVDSNGQIVVRVHQAGRRDDTVAVIIGIVAKRQVKFVLIGQQARHGRFGRAVHAHHAVFIQMHKAERLINGVIHQGQIEFVVLSNALPVSDAGTAKRIDADFQARFLNRREIDDL